MISVKLKQQKELLSLGKTLSKRVAAVQRKFVYDAAVHVKEIVQAKLPQNYANLRGALEVVRGDTTAPLYAVRAVASTQNLASLHQESVAVYVTLKAGTVRVPSEVKTLSKYSPWPISMLPFFPRKVHATLMHRRVSRIEYDRLVRLREGDRRLWEPAMRAAGVRPRTEQTDTAGAESASDSAFQSLSLEFGVGGPSVPHWRPAIRSLLSGKFSGRFSQSALVRRALLDGAFRGWRTWDTLGASSRASVAELSEYQAFQDRLGIRG